MGAWLLVTVSVQILGVQRDGTGETGGVWAAALRQEMPRLCIALGLSAFFPHPRWHFICVLRLQGFPNFLSDFLLFLTGLGAIGMELESGVSCRKHCRVVLVTGVLDTAADASAKGAEKKQSHLPVCSSQSPPNPGVSPSAPPHSSAEICPASPTAAICQRVFSSNHVKPRGKEPAQIILCLASLKAPHWSQSKCPVAVPGLSPENMVCRAHSFAIRLMCWHISPGQMQAASREAAARLTRANVPWRNKQDEKKITIRTAALVSWSRNITHI